MIDKHSSINDYFDNVYVINLPGRNDNKVNMLQKLGRLRIKADFISAQDIEESSIARQRSLLFYRIIGHAREKDMTGSLL